VALNCQNTIQTIRTACYDAVFS